MSESTAGVIHDIGYRKYDGVRLGRAHVVRSLYTHSLRTAFGLGRGLKAKIFPGLTLAAIVTAAVVIAAIRSQTGEEVSTYPEFVDVTGIMSLIFLATAAPELLSRDLRSRVLALYFARPVSRPDYVFAKYAAMVTAIFLLIAGPQLIMYAGVAFDVDGFGQFRRATTDLLAGWAYTALYALVAGAVALLAASLTGRRAFAAAAVVAAFMVTVPVAGLLTALGSGTVAELAGLANPVWIVEGVGVWLFDHEVVFDPGGFGPLYAVALVAVVAGSLALLLVRYRRVER